MRTLSKTAAAIALTGVVAGSAIALADDGEKEAEAAPRHRVLIELFTSQG